MGDKIKELAERTLTGWHIKSEMAWTAPAGPDTEADKGSGGEGEREVASPDRGTSPDPQSGAMLKFMSKVSCLSTSQSLRVVTCRQCSQWRSVQECSFSSILANIGTGPEYLWKPYDAVCKASRSSCTAD